MCEIRKAKYSCDVSQKYLFPVSSVVMFTHNKTQLTTDETQFKRNTDKRVVD